MKEPTFTDGISSSDILGANMKNKIDVEFKSDYMSLRTLYEEKIENLRTVMEKSEKNNLKIEVMSQIK